MSAKVTLFADFTKKMDKSANRKFFYIFTDSKNVYRKNQFCIYLYPLEEIAVSYID